MKQKFFKFYHKLWEKCQKAFDFPFPTLFYSRFQDGVKCGRYQDMLISCSLSMIGL